MQRSLGSMCPQIIQGYYGNITQDSTENGMCSDGYFDSCKQSTHFKLNIDENCSNMFGKYYLHMITNCQYVDWYSNI